MQPSVVSDPAAVDEPTRAIRLPHLGWLLLIYAFAGLAVVLPYMFGAWGAGQTTAGKLLLVALVWSSARLSLIIGRGLDRIVSLFFWLYVYVFLAVAPLVQLNRHRFSLPGTYTSSDLTEASVMILVGLAAYETARMLRRLPTPYARLADGVLRRELVSKRVFVAGLLSCAVSLYIVKSLGGVGIFFSSRQDVSQSLGQSGVSGNANAVLKTAFMSIPPLLALLCGLYMRKSVGRKQFPLWWFAPIVAVNIIVNNPISQSRIWFGTVAVALLATWLTLSKPRTFRYFTMAAIIGVLVIFPYADRYRYNQTGSAPTLSITETMTHKSDHDSYQALANGVQFVHEDGTSHGRQLLGIATFFVPRSMWAGKPQDTGIVVAQFEHYTFQNLSAPLWVEGYVNFGIIGTGLFLFGFGLLSETLEGIWLNRRLRIGGTVALMVPIFAAYQLILLRGSLLAATARPFIGVAVLLLLTSRPTAMEPTPSA